VDLTGRFRSAIGQLWADSVPQWEVLPAVIARACVAAVPVDGAGISLTHALRVPLGFSDDRSARAERLQVTLGEGPCLTAAANRQPLVADADEIARQWPLFHRQLVTATPFRSVASLPLRFGNERPFGALDLYSNQSDGAEFPDPAQLQETAAAVSQTLLSAPTIIDPDGASVPAWIDAEPAHRRMRVWTVIGMLATQSKLRSADALDLMRGYAFNQDLTLDDLSSQVIDGSLPIQRIWPSDRSG
jgi:hypothetical protein